MYYTCKVCKGTHLLPEYLTEEESYREGFLSGLMWKDTWETHKPGGPWVNWGCPVSSRGYKAWLKGWDNGHNAKLNKEFAVVEGVSDYSFITVVVRPRYDHERNQLCSDIKHLEYELEVLKDKLKDLDESVK